MEMQLFILGHVLLLALCLTCVVGMAHVSEWGGGLTFVTIIFLTLLLFLPLELLYWVLHEMFVN